MTDILSILAKSYTLKNEVYNDFSMKQELDAIANGYSPQEIKEKRKFYQSPFKKRNLSKENKEEDVVVED